MANTASSHEIPQPSLSRPSLSVLLWALLALLGVAALAYGLFRVRGPSLMTPPVALVGTPGAIRTYGSLPELFDGGDSKAPLAALPGGPGVVAVGSLSGLRGEIAIVRGVPWLSYPAAGGRMTVETGPHVKEESAAFVALADVMRWQSEPLEAPVPFEQLATVIEGRARRAGVDASGPFPLLIDGRFSAIELNVANGPALGSHKPTPERLKETAARSALPQAEGTIVGFFAASGGERLIHPGQRLHLHVVLPDARYVGHLDSVRIEPGAQLHLPDSN